MARQFTDPEEVYLPEIDPEEAVGWPLSDYQREIDQWEAEEDFIAAYEGADEFAYDLLMEAIRG